MAIGNDKSRWSTDGKFFRRGSSRMRIHCVTYGPFPGGWPEVFHADFQKIADAGFNSIRLYEMPSLELLNAAARSGLAVFGGLQWGQTFDFFATPAIYSSARMELSKSLKSVGDHSALAGIYVGNEIPSDLARWLGPYQVRVAIEGLISLGRELAPWLLFAYANYPSTEYLEPENADFTAFNVYLEHETDFRNYLKRLHHIAGDRPLVISEFGLDSRRHGMEAQAATLAWANRAACETEAAGLTIFAWSDRWQTATEVLDWDFGLTDRSGQAKAALKALPYLPEVLLPATAALVSVIVCTRNGAGRIGDCLKAIRNMTDANLETIVVDDGSTDGTGDLVKRDFPWVRLLQLSAVGLSAARNQGAAMAAGEILAFTDDDCEPDREWISRLRPVLGGTKFAAAGGPNLSPPPKNWQEAVVCATPGAPSHVMLSDDEAEHLPGCNLVVKKLAFDSIGGFDPQFRTAGDDVDFCWRLRTAGYRLGFVPGAFVWHRRRASLLTFLRQQIGYGRAERLLLAKHPDRFSTQGNTRWLGFVYGGGPVRVMPDSIIYHGPMGEAGYQAIVNRMLPLRGLRKNFGHLKARLALWLIRAAQPRVRAWMRNRRFFLSATGRKSSTVENGESSELAILPEPGVERDHYITRLRQQRWTPCGPTSSWDLMRGDAKICLAIEGSGTPHRRLLVRVRGVDPSRARIMLERKIRASPSPPTSVLHDD